LRAHLFDLSSQVDSFKLSSKMKSNPRFEVYFLPFYAQNEWNLSENDRSEMVRGVGFEPKNLCGNNSFTLQLRKTSNADKYKKDLIS